LKRQLSKQKGFTLVEVLIAVAILSIGILATTKLQISFMQSNAKARLMTIGTAKAQEKIEELMSLSYGDPLFADTDSSGDPGFGTGGFGSVGANADQNDETDPRYKFYWNVAVNSPATGLKTINLIVQWPDEKNIVRNVDYTFIKSNM